MESSTRRVLLACAQVGVVVLALVVIAAAALIMLLAQLSHNRDEAMLWTVGAAVIGLLALAGLVRLFIYLNRKRRGTGVAQPSGAPAVTLPVDPAADPVFLSALQTLRIALIAILLLGIGGLALRFMGGRPAVGLLVVSLVVFALYVAPYAFALLRISDRFDALGVATAHAFAWVSLIMSFRLLALFTGYTVAIRQVLVISALNVLLDMLVIYCGIRLWRAIRVEVFVAILVGALIYRAGLDLLAPLFYSRFAF